MDSTKIKCYDGKSDVKVFLTRVSLVTAIKEYDGEKKAQFLASTLLPPALDVYMRLSDADKKDFGKIEEALLKEFQKGQLNREEAIHILGSRCQQEDESPQTFAYKLVELVKLSYPTFDDAVRLTIAKDYYMRGVHPDMQVALKSWGQFEVSDVHALAVETVRLELAGIKSYGKAKSTSTGSVCNAAEKRSDGDSENFVDAIAEKVLEKLKVSVGAGYFGQPSTSSAPTDDVNFAGKQPYYQSYRGRGSNRRNRGGQRRGGSAPRFGNQQRKCRSCQSTEHIVRDCPTRFCQACGNRGHDQWSDQCPNHHT